MGVLKKIELRGSWHYRFITPTYKLWWKSYRLKSYSPQWNIFNSISCAPIIGYLNIKYCVLIVKSQIANFILFLVITCTTLDLQMKNVNPISTSTLKTFPIVQRRCNLDKFFYLHIFCKDLGPILTYISFFSCLGFYLIPIFLLRSIKFPSSWNGHFVVLFGNLSHTYIKITTISPT
jgi:hypothetical protein